MVNIISRMLKWVYVAIACQLYNQCHFACRGQKYATTTSYISDQHWIQQLVGTVCRFINVLHMFPFLKDPLTVTHHAQTHFLDSWTQNVEGRSLVKFISVLSQLCWLTENRHSHLQRGLIPLGKATLFTTWRNRWLCTSRYYKFENLFIRFFFSNNEF